MGGRPCPVFILYRGDVGDHEVRLTGRVPVFLVLELRVKLCVQTTFEQIAQGSVRIEIQTQHVMDKAGLYTVLIEVEKGRTLMLGLIGIIEVVVEGAKTHQMEVAGLLVSPGERELLVRPIAVRFESGIHLGLKLRIRIIVRLDTGKRLGLESDADGPGLLICAERVAGNDHAEVCGRKFRWLFVVANFLVKESGNISHISITFS